MTTIQTFLNAFFKEWDSLGLTKEQLYQLMSWAQLQSAGSPVHTVLTGLNDSLRETARSMDQVLGQPIAPAAFSGFQLPAGENAKVYISRWLHGTVPSDPNLTGLLSLSLLLVFHAELLPREDGCAALREPGLTLSGAVDALCAQAGWRQELSHFLPGLGTRERFLLPFLLAALFYDRAPQPTLLLKWLVRRLDALSCTPEDPELAAFQRTYLDGLFCCTRNVDVRDLSEGQLYSALQQDAGIDRLYAMPRFSLNGRDAAPITDRPFRRLVQAASGCGKSTLLQAIISSVTCGTLSCIAPGAVPESSLAAYQAIRQQLGIRKHYLPLYITAGLVDRYSEEELETLTIEQIAWQEGCPDFADSIRGLLEETSAPLLLIDALDEIQGDERRALLGRMVDDFLSRHPRASVLLVCRPISLTCCADCGFYQELEFLTLRPFDEDNIRDLVARWNRKFQTLGGPDLRAETADEACREILGSRYLRELARNPYLLTHILWYRAHNQVPRVQDIIGHVVRRLLNKRWPPSMYRSCRIDPELMEELLSCIAWEMLSQGRSAIPADQLPEAFARAAEALEETDITPRQWKKLSLDINTRAGLLILDQQGYAFHSPILACYLAACRELEQLRDCSETRLPDAVRALFRTMSDALHSGETPEILLWADVLLMLLHPSAAHLMGGNDAVSQALLRELLGQTASLDAPLLRVLAQVFSDLLCGTLGLNAFTRQTGSSLRLQMVRFLAQNPQLTDDSSWQDAEGVAGELRQLRTRGLLPPAKEVL